jgi:NodT family efflux transporter outer membrane factor (OMF) lipoprotein
MLIVAGLAACTVGPDFVRPSLPKNAGYVATIPSSARSGGPVLVVGRDISQEWWRVFQNEALSRLVAQALAANPSIKAASATLRQAEENAAASRGTLFPSVTGKASTTRLGFNAATIGQTYHEEFTLNLAQLAISYTLDIFGLNRRQIEAARAQAEYQRFQLEAAQLTLASNVVVTAIQEASLREQIAATNDVIALQQRTVKLAERQVTLGGGTQADVLTQQAALAQTQATLPTLARRFAQTRNQLHILVGRFPNQPLAAQFELDELHLPDELPVSLPSALVAQRPDILSSEAQLHAATAQVGIAIAEMLPQITLSAGYGNIGLGRLFGPGSTIYDLGASLSQPLFQGGQLLHQERAARAGLAGALALYRSTVLNAFGNVADVLQALETDDDAVAAQKNAERTAAASLSLAEAQYAAGGVSFLTLLNAQNTLAQARISKIQAETNRLTDVAALFQALGGGWWNRPSAAAAVGS